MFQCLFEGIVRSGGIARITKEGCRHARIVATAPVAIAIINLDDELLGP